MDREAGMARLGAEARRVADVMARAAVPSMASPEIVAAPARGAMRLAPQFVDVATASGFRRRRDTVDGFHPVARVDAFDVMALAAARRGGAGPIFTVAQVDAGRAYAALAERVAAEGMRASTMADRVSGGGGRDWIDGVIARSARLARMRAAIPVDLVDGVGCDGLRVRSVVDGVCLGGMTVGQLLRKQGVAVWAERRQAALRALVRGLDAIYGL